MSRSFVFFGLALAVVVGVGCGGGAPPETEESVEVSLTPVTFEQWQGELAALEGQIVVVDMWATWCVPCVERFPKMVELFHEYSPRGVTFVSMCLDDREDAEAVAYAREFLGKQKAVFANYLMDEIVTEGFVKLDLLGIPAVYVYAPDGERRYKLTADDPYNQFTDEDVESAIEDLLAESSL
ncbi:MAG: TlpA family protein disulfide reductase [Acidobacteria bacterium]|nr:MAG: TlpA family protein disulfide reductase [Acidobacteriota bacterium]